MSNDISLRKSIREFWFSVLAAVLAFALPVTATYIIESVSWHREQNRLELKAQQKRLEQINKAKAIGVYTFENVWNMADIGIRSVDMTRRVVKLEPNVEYLIGQLSIYDTREKCELSPDDIPPQFDRVLPAPDDDPYFFDPIFTFISENTLHIRSSLDGGDVWMEVGSTERGIKTDTLKYIPENPITDDKRSYSGVGAISVRVPLNGSNGIEYGSLSPEISEEMRLCNYSEHQRLGDIYSSVPSEFADRERVVRISQLIIEQTRPPLNKLAADKTPIVAVRIRIILRNYGAWNVSSEEYEQMKFAVTDFSNRNFREFSPYATAEPVIY